MCLASGDWPENPKDVFGNTVPPAKPTIASLDAECKTMLGSDWRVWEPDEWMEWYWVSTIGSGILTIVQHLYQL